MDKNKAINLIRKWTSAYINNCVSRDNKKDLAEMNDVITFVETQCIASLRAKEKHGRFDKTTDI